MKRRILAKRRKNPDRRGVANFDGFSFLAMEELPVLVPGWVKRKNPKYVFPVGNVEVSLYSVFQGDYRWVWIAREDGEMVAFGGMAEYNGHICEMLAIVLDQKQRKGLYSKILLELAEYFGELWSDMFMSAGCIGAWEKAKADFVEEAERYVLRAKDE